MGDLVYCGSCGGQIAATAKFCKHCGASQEPFREAEPAPPQPPAQPPAPPSAEPAPSQPPAPSAQPSPPPPSPPAPAAQAAEPSPPPAAATAGARESAERVAPGAGELADQIAQHLRTPGVALAGIAALTGLAVCLAGGLLVALLAPNASFIAIGGDGLLKETLAQAAAFSQANLSTSFGEGAVTLRMVPVLFVLLPILGVAIGVVTAAGRTGGMPARDRLLWAASSGVPFALAMLVISLSVDRVQDDLLNAQVELSSGSVFLLSLVWGALGGVLGMLYAFQQEGVEAPQLLPAAPARLAGVAWTALRPLGLALIAAGLLGTAVWIVQMTRDDEYHDFPPRSTAVAVGEQVAYAGDHAVDFLTLGAGARQRFTGSYAAVPIDRTEYFELAEGGSRNEPPTYNVFDFSGTMSAALFIPMLIVLIAIPALLALYAGFAVVRRVGEGRSDRAAAWGAAVGPLWAVAMALVAALARKTIFGDPTGDSVFVAFLLGGAALGALGGLLAAQGSTTAPAPPSTAPPVSPPPPTPPQSGA